MSDAVGCHSPWILPRIAEDDLHASSAKCTHLDRIVDLRRDKELIWCWCHIGVYGLKGNNIGGPPPRPLSSFEVDLVKTSDGAAKIVISKA